MSTVLPSTREIEVLAPQASLPAVQPKAEAPSRLEYGLRLLYVIWVLAGFGLYLYCDLRGWLRKRDQNENTEQRMRRQAARLRERLIKLGPTFIKIGQALGTRADLLPVAYVDELAKLQNRVPAFPNREAQPEEGRRRLTSPTPRRHPKRQRHYSRCVQAAPSGQFAL